MNYEPMEIIVRRPLYYVGSGNYEQKITIITPKSEKELVESILTLGDIEPYQVVKITEGESYGM